MKFVETLGYRVFSDDLSKIQFDNKQCVINTISPNSYGMATKNFEFEKALKNSDYLVLDGVYFALSSIILEGKNIKKNQAPELFYHFMERANEFCGKVFFLGSSNETLKKIEKKTRAMYPDIKLKTFSPPFKKEFSEKENAKMIETINSFQPDILFVGMTAPKQEIWSVENKTRLKAKLIIGIGGVFDWYAGNYKEISKFWWHLRLGWLIRAVQRPELLRRNIPYYYIFLKDVIKTVIGLNKWKRTKRF